MPVHQLDIEELRPASTREVIRFPRQPAVSRFEALIRWRDPERGLVPPPLILKAAEEAGLLYRLAQWVIERACQLPASPPYAFRFISVNVEVSTVLHADFVGDMARPPGDGVQFQR